MTSRKRSKGGVGRSARTPVKHAIMNAIVGQEVGAVSRLKWIKQLLLLDLCSGDAAPEVGEDWHRSTSAGIFAYHGAYPALNARIKTRIELCEVAPATHARELANLGQYMPGLGYVPIRDLGNEWQLRRGCGTVLRATCCDSGKIEIARGAWWNDHTAVLMVCDPNAMSHGPFRNELLVAAEDAGVRAIRGLLVLGCNPSGIQGVLTRESREHWFEEVAELVRLAGPRRDVLLGAILGANGRLDAAKWAYMLFTHKDWRAKDEKTFQGAAKRGGFGLRTVWASHPQEFDDVLRQLFLTRREREEDDGQDRLW